MIVLMRALALLAATFSASAQAPANTAAASAGEPAAIVLLLPAQTTPYARAAEAVRQGFFAAQALADAATVIQVVEIDETPGQVAAAIAAAQQRGARLVVGPLTRDAVEALARSGNTVLPVLALNAPPPALPLPASMLAFGLPVEEEARSAVRLLLLDGQGGAVEKRPLAVLAGSGALAQRASAAYSDALQTLGLRPEMLSFARQGTAVSTLSRRLATQPYRAVLLALDGAEAAALRAWLPQAVPAIGTSRLNAGNGTSVRELDGIHFVDMPWLLEPDHPAVMIYPRPKGFALEQERLYALGIDAFRIAAEWMKGQQRFELDGVTGRLRVDPALGGRVERSATLAVFAKGKAERKEVIR